ncbi:MAG: alpha/beta hydrolase [Alphaproteobacteria bacterium]|jgi:pimeloyl-ACP methyl ester carboxylesterase
MIIEEISTLTAEDGVTFDVKLHRDDSAPRGTAFLIMHPTTSWHDHFILKLLVERGYAGLGCANRYTGREAELILEYTVLDWAACVSHLRDLGYERIIGIGNSGGGEIVTCFQSEAVKPTMIGAAMGGPPDLTKAKLTPMDGLVMLNAHAGRPINLTLALDPSVGGEDGNDPRQYDPSLDMYNPENGPPYSQDFRDRYEAVQVERNHKITRWCEKVIAEIESAANPLMTDMTFIVHRTDANLRFLDNSIDSSDRTGLTIWDEDPKLANYTPGPLRGARTRLRIMTARSWLSQRSLLRSQFDVEHFMPQCEIPTIVLCGTADSGGPAHSLKTLESSPDPDVSMVWIKDGTHFMRGQEDKQAEAADHIASWAKERGFG